MLLSLIVAEHDATFSSKLDQIKLELPQSVESEFEDSANSDFERDKFGIEKKVKGKVDGLEKILLCLPFAKTESSVLVSALEVLKRQHEDVDLNLLKDHFKNDPNWA